MPRTYLKPPLTIILLLSFSFILSCSTTKDKKPNHPSKLLREAKRFYKVGAPERAKDNINMIMEDFPDSNERIAALMLIADVHYKEEEYDFGSLNVSTF